MLYVLLHWTDTLSRSKPVLLVTKRILKNMQNTTEVLAIIQRLLPMKNWKKCRKKRQKKENIIIVNKRIVSLAYNQLEGIGGNIR